MEKNKSVSDTSSTLFSIEFRQRAEVIDKALSYRLDKKIFPVLSQRDFVGQKGICNLLESMKYTTCAPGKRFRPVLSMLIAEELGVARELVLPLCLSVEMIHCYSLIHDDLPCMDDDDFRRGRPSNHKVFGESTALLAGDALLTESFLNLSESYSNMRPDLIGPLIGEVASAAGLSGMIGGQAMDIYSDCWPDISLDLASLEVMHSLKTGKLIEVSAVGVGLIAGMESDALINLRCFGQELGLAFQVADDILDHSQKNERHKSFVGILGLEQTQSYLSQLNNNILRRLESLNCQSDLLRQLVLFNNDRKK